MTARGALFRLRRGVGAVARELGTEIDLVRSRKGRADLALFHQFANLLAQKGLAPGDDPRCPAHVAGVS